MKPTARKLHNEEEGLSLSCAAIVSIRPRHRIRLKLNASPASNQIIRQAPQAL